MAKVDVVTVEDVKIKRWRWCSDWIDVAILDVLHHSYLLQMCVTRTNAKIFRMRTIVRYCSSHAIGDLTQMKARA